MTKLTVQDFSCIKEAALDITNITLLIGPQASGKSVISKLIYFFYEIAGTFYVGVDDLLPFIRYERAVLDKFREWFPPAAWGGRRFRIEFTAGTFTVQIARRNLRSASDRL